MVKVVMVILSLITGIREYETINEVGNFEHSIIQINYYKDEKSTENLIESKQIDVENQTSLSEINPNEYLPDNYFKIPKNIPIVVTEKKNIINIIYQKQDYYINYYYSKNYSLTDIGSKQTLDNLFNERKRMQYVNKDPLLIHENNEMTNYYKRMKFSYQIVYYYDQEIDPSLTEKRSLFYGTETRTFEDKKRENFKIEYSTVDDEPLTITENLEANMIYVYYRKY